MTHQFVLHTTISWHSDSARFADLTPMKFYYITCWYETLNNTYLQSSMMGELDLRFVANDGACSTRPIYVHAHIL